MFNYKRRLSIFLVNHIFKGTRPRFFKIKSKLLNWGGYKIGVNTKIVGPIYIYGNIIIGENTWVGKNFTVNGNGTVIIGNNCDIAPEVIFQTGGHSIGSHEHRAGEGKLFTQTVGNGVWIGGRTTIFNDIQIGDGAVIAGCSCVTKDVKPDVIVGGVPAKIIRELSDV